MVPSCVGTGGRVLSVHLLISPSGYRIFRLPLSYKTPGVITQDHAFTEAMPAKESVEYVISELPILGVRISGV